MLKILRTFYKFLFEKKFWAVVFVFLLTLSPIIDSLNPYFYKLLVDSIPTLNYQYLEKIILIFIGLRFLSTLVHMAKFFVSDILSTDAFPNAVKAVFKHIHDLDFAFHSNKSSGSLISAIKRGEGAFWNFNFSLHFRLFEVAIRFIVMLFFFRAVDIRILWFVIISFALGIAMSIIFVYLNIKYRKKVNEYEDEISAVIVDNMINFETVKLFANEKWEENRLSDKYKLWKKAVWKYAFTYRGLDVGMGVIVNLSLYSIILYTIKLAVDGSITVGDFVLVATFLQAFFGELWELIWGLRDIAKSYADIQKFFGILESEITVLDPASPIEPQNVKGEIDFKNVTFAYDRKSAKAITNLNLTIKQGQSVALVGRSGAGKTTLAKLLLRFYDPDKGSITIDGLDLRSMSKSSLRNLFGVVPQEPILFNNTVAYNISYGKDGATKKEIVAASKMANIHDFIETLPEKYETEVGERGIKLSGGQKQRLAIARMILSNPDIIIFDEATSQLDSESEKLIQEAFWKAAKDKTTVVIAHRLSTIKKVDRIIVLEDGKIVEVGTHADLVANKNSLYNHFWSLQVRE